MVSRATEVAGAGAGFRGQSWTQASSKGLAGATQSGDSSMHVKLGLAEHRVKRKAWSGLYDRGPLPHKVALGVCWADTPPTLLTPIRKESCAYLVKGRHRGQRPWPRRGRWYRDSGLRPWPWR